LLIPVLQVFLVFITSCADPPPRRWTFKPNRGRDDPRLANFGEFFFYDVG
jgi:hypothetical protein